MACAGDCFNIELNELPPRDAGESIPASQASASDVDDVQRLYKPLKPWQTRVLDLRPDPTSQDFVDLESGPLRAELLVVNLLDKDVVIEVREQIISFSALSYVWGPPDTSRVITCNGIEMLISQTLAVALDCVRGNVRYLWVDALCINQHDNREKAQQVSRMLRIYQKADLVIAWLGVPTPETHLALACLRRFRTMGEEIQRANSIGHSEACLAKTKAMCAALMFFYNTKWLSRTWIRQEVYGARVLAMQCASQQISDQVRRALLPLSHPSFMLCTIDNMNRRSAI